MLWLLLWLPLCSYFLLPKLGLLATLLLVDRLIPSFDLLKRNTLALITHKPISAALEKPARLPTYDRCTVFLLASTLYHIVLIALYIERQAWLELLLVASALPLVQQWLIGRIGLVVQWRDQRVKRLAAKLVVRSIKSISLALLGQPALVHSQDVLPFIDRAPELVLQILKHGGMTLLLLYVKRYSQHSYYVLLKYVYYFQTAQLRRPSAAQARRKLISLLDKQQWSEFALDGKTFGLVMVLFHQGEPDVPQWIATLNFGIARFVAVWTLCQGLHAWNAQWTPIGCAAALLLVQRQELEAYWKTCAAVVLGAGLLWLEQCPLWLAALLSTSRPLWFGTRSLVKLLLKRLQYGLELQLPAFWLLSASLLPGAVGSVVPLLIYALTLPWHSMIGLIGLLVLGFRSNYAFSHLIACAACCSACYTMIAYSLRQPNVPMPKITVPLRFRVIENYKAT